MSGTSGENDILRKPEDEISIRACVFISSSLLEFSHRCYMSGTEEASPCLHGLSHGLTRVLPVGISNPVSEIRVPSSDLEASRLHFPAASWIFVMLDRYVGVG